MVVRLRSRYLVLALSFFLPTLFFGSTSESIAQEASQERREPTLAACVPASARIFISLNHPADLHRALNRAKAVRLLSLLGGRADKGDDADFNTMVQSLAGTGHPIPLEDLMSCDAGLIADSLAGLANPIWLVRAADDGMVRRWFPQHTQSGSDSDAARMFRTDEGRFVCLRGNVAAVAPRSSDWTQLGNVLRAMTVGEADVLEKLPAYRESIAYLPSKPLATLYFAGQASYTPNEPQTDDHLAVGIYAKGETIDLAFRGSQARSPGKGAISAAAMERMLKLPQTTLGAYITTVDWTAFTAQQESAVSGTVARYVRLLKELSQADLPPDAIPPRLGRHLILAWGQDFSARGVTPQAAALIESPEASRMTESARRVVISLGRILSTLELRNVSEDLQVEGSTHLGVTVSSIPLRRYAEHSRFAWVKVLADLAPSWAASGDWLLVTLTPDHMNQLLDAQIGFLSVLGNDRDARALREAPQQDLSAAFLQGAMASSTLRLWEQSLNAANLAGSIQDLWKTSDSPETNNKQLGIEIGDGSDFGLVEIATVFPSTPAEGRLKPGDRIIGVDGRLLEMVAPAEDLRHWWEEAAPGSSHTMRILRAESIMELDVMRRLDQGSMTDLFAQPLDALHQLSLLCETIPAATLQVHDTGDRHFSALLKLRASSTKK